jgi:hypothetical protein
MMIWTFWILVVICFLLLWIGSSLAVIAKKISDKSSDQIESEYKSEPDLVLIGIQVLGVAAIAGIAYMMLSH